MAQNVLFEPGDRFRHLTDNYHATPQYLFRAFSPRSNGINSPTRIASAAVQFDRDTSDILTRDRDDAMIMLEEHLLWKNDDEDNLVSWTPSLIFALQLALYRAEKDIPPYPAERIYICMLPTRLFPDRTFMSARGLLEAYGVKNEEKLKHEYHDHEFLSQGEIRLPEHGSATLAQFMTTFAQMKQHGLHDIFPPYDPWEEPTLFIRVSELRTEFEDAEGPMHPTMKEIHAAEAISTSCFPGINEQLVTFLALLSCAPRFDNDTYIADYAHKHFKGNTLQIFNHEPSD